MFIGAILGTLALAGLIAAVLFFRRVHHDHKDEKFIVRTQASYEQKLIDDKAKIAALREKLKHELPHSDPNLIVHHIDIDEQGRGIVERLLEKVPEVPLPNIHGDHTLDVVECPDFISYTFPERYHKPDGRDETVEELIVLEDDTKK